MIVSMHHSRRVWDDALALPAEEREALAFELLQSVDAGVEPGGDAALIAELERRARAVADGTADVVDWPAVREALRAKVRGGGVGRADPDR